jgi:LysM repeat protein
MDNNDNHLKSPQTGGLKLMTVFIVVLALHVVVIGGFAIHGLMTGGGADADLADKTHKTVKVATDADAPLPDGSTAPAPAAATTPGTSTPAPDAAATADMNPDAAEPPSAPAPATASTTPAPAPNAPTMPASPDSSMTAAATPASPSPATSTTSTPSGPLASGPAIASPLAPESVQNDQTAEQEAVAPTAPDGVIAPPKPYTVKVHDSLAKIAKRNHVSLAQLRETNSLKTDALRIGQKLMIPAATNVAAADAANAPASAPATHGPNRTLLGDDVPDSTAPAKKTVASTSHDEALVMPSDTGSHHTYTVVKGDTMSKIAHKFHLTTAALMAANDSIDARKLRIGQKLHIPSQGSRSANIAAPAPVAPPALPKAQPEPAEVQPASAPSAQLANFMP